jgi:hypothetical protein
MNSSIGSEGIEHPRAETLAAFIDGRLARRERREMVEHLDACPDCYEEYAETVRFLQDEEPGGRVLAIGREDRTRSLRPLFWTAAAIAAVLVAALVVPGLLRETSAPSETSTDRWAAALESAQVAADSILATESPTGQAFGPSGIDRRPSAFRAGVRLTDLQVALLAGDRAAARFAATELEPMAPDLRGAIDRRWRWRDATRQSLLDIEAEYGQTTSALLTGARAEAGRLAAASGDSAFFQTPEGMEVYQALVRHRAGDAPPPDDLEALQLEFERWIENP